MRFWAYVTLPVLGALMAYLAMPEQTVTYPEVIVPAARIIEREPDTVRTIVDRVRFVTVPPRQVAIAPMAASVGVAAFCAPSVDTVYAAPVMLMRSVSHDPGWLWRSDRLLVTGPTSYGDLVARDYNVRPGFSVRASGDSVLVRSPRLGLLRELGEVLFIGGLGFAAGRVF